jgi:hypothetical protein
MAVLERYCAYCGKLIGGNQIACNKHYEDYQRDKNEPWMKFYKADLEREYKNELFEYEIHTKGDEVELPREYNKITPELIEKIYELRAEKGWGYVRIAKTLNLSEQAVKYHTNSKAASNVKGKTEARLAFEAKLKENADD